MQFRLEQSATSEQSVTLDGAEGKPKKLVEGFGTVTLSREAYYKITLISIYTGCFFLTGPPLRIRSF